MIQPRLDLDEFEIRLTAFTTEAWQRGYDDRMYGVPDNRETTHEDRIRYDVGVRSAEDDSDRDQIDDPMYAI